MTPIKFINELPDEFKRIRAKKPLKNVDTGKSRTEKSSTASRISNSGKDSVNISTTAKALLEEKEKIATLSRQMGSVATLDTEALEMIKERVNSGYYSKPDVLEKVADAVAAGVNPPAASEVAISNSSQSAATTRKTSPLDEIKLKILRKEYNSNEVLDTIVKGILGEN